MANSVDRRLAALLQHVMPRRQNVQGATDTAGAAPAACSALSAGLRAVILGNTNGGGFGHGLDSLFASTQVAVIAVSDPDPNGRAKAVQAVQRSQLSNPTPPRQHEQWADLVDAHSGDFQLAVVAPRWTTEHYTAGMSVLTAGAHLLLEKPFVHVLAEADEMLALAEAKGLKIAVAHQIRLAPSVLVVKALLPGLLGDLLQIDTWGKMDRRAGGEDLVVLGCHIFDLARFFAGAMPCGVPHGSPRVGRILLATMHDGLRTRSGRSQGTRSPPSLGCKTTCCSPTLAEAGCSRPRSHIA